MSARRTLADLSVFGKGYIRSRIGAFFSLIFPVILILLFGAIFSGGSSGPTTVYVQNQDGGAVSTQLVSALNGSVVAHNSTWPIKLISVPPGQNFTSFLLAHSASDGIVIPAGFTGSVLSGKHSNLTLYGNPASTTSAIVSGVVNGVANAFNLQAVHGVPILGVHTLTAASQSYKYIDFLIPGLIGFSVLTSPMFALVNISSEYKRDKVFKLLSLTPLTKTEWLLSKIVWYILLTVISFVLMSVTGIFLFGAHISFTWGIIPFLLLGPFLFVSLGMLVGTVSNSPESAAVVGNLITFPMMFLSGTFFPVSMMPAYLQSVAHILPLFYLIDGLNDVMTYGNYPPAYVDMGILIVLSLVIFGLAVRFFKWRED
ncbi:MAG: ABC transporter permease [Nitrososphaerales archaeon]|nr:ABC transporter permease [Nitrososphaerales archaeon]